MPNRPCFQDRGRKYLKLKVVISTLNKLRLGSLWLLETEKIGSGRRQIVFFDQKNIGVKYL